MGEWDKGWRRSGGEHSGGGWFCRHVGWMHRIAPDDTAYFPGDECYVFCRAHALAQGIAPPEECHGKGSEVFADAFDLLAKAIPLKPLPTADEAIAIQAEHIARADFESDPAVISFVASVIDNRPPADPAGKAQYDKAMGIAWERDEHGWRTACQERAKRIVSRMYGKAAGK